MSQTPACERSPDMRLHTNDRPKIAMVICIRDEARFLAANLLYHHAIGVGRAYVYLDRCTDGSEQIAASCPWVKVIRVASEDGARFKYVTDLQITCMNRALEDARREGYDWLLTLDADEFAIGENPASENGLTQSARDRGDLMQLVRGAKPETEMIRLTTREVLPLDLDPQEPFWKQRFVLLDLDHRREILDPAVGLVKPKRGYLAHAHGKSLVRTSADVQAYTPHGWTRWQGISYPDVPGFANVPTEDRGSHLHYAFVDWRQWLEKHRKFSHVPDRWRTGSEVPFPAQCWKEIARRFNDEDGREYFRRWVALPEPRARELVASGVAGVECIVEQMLRESGALSHETLRLPGQPRRDAIEDWKLPDSFWREGPSGVTRLAGGGVRLRIADLSADCTKGFFGPMFDGQHRYRRIFRKSELSVDVPAADYAVTLTVPEWQAGSLSVRLDGRKVPVRARRGPGQTLAVWLSKQDFAPTDAHRVQVELHPTLWQRLWKKRVSAGISEIAITPIRRAA